MQKLLAIKIAVIFVVGLVVFIPVNMVKYKVYERQQYLEQAKSAVAQSWTGQQLIVTPVLVIPYRTAAATTSGFYTDEGQAVVNKTAASKLSVILPEHLTNQVEVVNNSVFKGIYEVLVYNSKLGLSGQFSAEKLQRQLDKIYSVPHFESVGEPYLALHISDMRGIDKAPELSVNQRAATLQPGSQLPSLPMGLHSGLGDVSVLKQTLAFDIDISLRGMGSFSFVPLADDATTRLQSNWPHPEFIGASLPKERDISSSGFTASWSSSRYSSNGLGLINKCLDNENTCHALTASSSGVNFIKPVDIYVQSERSIKYALLFIGLSFITFFIFEHIKTVRIHPIQYAFVGLAIAVFYLLLISLAEHIAFYIAYLIAVSCCSGLLLFYVRYLLQSFFSSLLFALMIVGLYGLLYVIVQAEDFALLMGSTLVFLVLAVLMVVTRKIDWYALAEKSVEKS